MCVCACVCVCVCVCVSVCVGLFVHALSPMSCIRDAKTRYQWISNPILNAFDSWILIEVWQETIFGMAHPRVQSGVLERTTFKVTACTEGSLHKKGVQTLLHNL